MAIIVRDRHKASGAPATADGIPVVLHVATRYLRGGSERRIRDIIASLPEARHHVVVGRESDVALARSELAPASLTVIPTLVRRPDPLRDLPALGRLIRLIGANHYDLVVTHQSKAGVLARTAAGLCGVPVVHSLSMANFGPGYPAWQSALFRRLEARLAGGTTAYLVVGADLARRYREIGAPADKLHVVRSGIPLPIEPVPARTKADVCHELGLPTDRPLVLYLGSLEARKNVLELPRLLGRLVSHGDSRRPYLVVAGEGPLAAALEDDLAAASLAEDAELVGFIRDPGPLIEAAALVVLLSSAEGMPQTLVQAAAAGTPFVAYAVDGVQELIDLGADGAAVPLGDLPAAASAARSLLDRGLKVQGPSIDLSPWSADVIAAEYRRIVGGVLAAGSPPPRRFAFARSL
jgi:glycosyltransferase involved in cell wall biosynthesis